MSAHDEKGSARQSNFYDFEVTIVFLRFRFSLYENLASAAGWSARTTKENAALSINVQAGRCFCVSRSRGRAGSGGLVLKTSEDTKYSSDAISASGGLISSNANLASAAAWSVRMAKVSVPPSICVQEDPRSTCGWSRGHGCTGAQKDKKV